MRWKTELLKVLELAIARLEPLATYSRDFAIVEMGKTAIAKAKGGTDA